MFDSTSVVVLVLALLFSLLSCALLPVFGMLWLGVLRLRGIVLLSGLFMSVRGEIVWNFFSLVVLPCLCLS